MLCGIYGITNMRDGKVYIGQSKSIYSRWAEHIRALESGTHICKDLQSDYVTFGPEIFEFIVLEECKMKDLLLREDHYIKYLRADSVKLYNNLMWHQYKFISDFQRRETESFTYDNFILED